MSPLAHPPEQGTDRRVGQPIGRVHRRGRLGAGLDPGASQDVEQRGLPRGLGDIHQELERVVRIPGEAGPFRARERGQPANRQAGVSANDEIGGGAPSQPTHAVLERRHRPVDVVRQRHPIAVRTRPGTRTQAGRLERPREHVRVLVDQRSLMESALVRNRGGQREPAVGIPFVADGLLVPGEGQEAPAEEIETDLDAIGADDDRLDAVPDADDREPVRGHARAQGGVGDPPSWERRLGNAPGPQGLPLGQRERSLGDGDRPRRVRAGDLRVRAILFDETDLEAQPRSEHDRRHVPAFRDPSSGVADLEGSSAGGRRRHRSPPLG